MGDKELGEKMPSMLALLCYACVKKKNIENMSFGAEGDLQCAICA